MLLLLTAIHLSSRRGLVEVPAGGSTVVFLMLIVTFITANCNANSGFQPIAAGGDGAVVQYCAYVMDIFARGY